MEGTIVFRSRKTEKRFSPQGHTPEEIEIFRRVRQGDQQYREYTVLKNQGLAYESARQFYRAMGSARRTIGFDDLVQEASLALITAAETFKYWRGTRFSTHAGWWIFCYLTRYAKKHGYPVHIPGNVSAMARQYERSVQHINGKKMQEGWEQWYKKSLKQKQMPSLDLIIKAKENMDRDLITSDEKLNNVLGWREKPVIDEVNRRMGTEEVQYALQTLPRRLRRVIEMVYGFNQERPERRNFRVVGLELAKEGLGKGHRGSEKISHEMVRVLHRQAVRMLRDVLHIKDNGRAKTMSKGL